MKHVDLVLVLLTACVALQVLAARFAIPHPSLLVLGGAALALVPAFPDPGWIPGASSSSSSRRKRWTTSGDVTTTEPDGGRQESSSSAASRSFPSKTATVPMVSTRCPRSTIVASASR
jgi:hypothetical protein